MSQAQADRTKEYGNRIKARKYLLSIQKFGDNDTGDPLNLPDTNYGHQNFFRVPANVGDGGGDE